MTKVEELRDKICKKLNMHDMIDIYELISLSRIEGMDGVEVARRPTMASRVELLRNGIIQRLNNPEGLQEEEVDTLIAVVREEQKCEYDKLLEDDNYLRHYNDALIEQINKLDIEIKAKEKP